MVRNFEWTWNILRAWGSWNLWGFVSTRQKVILLDVSGLTLNLMSWACEGHASASKIKTFGSNVKQKVFNDEKC